MNPPLVCSVISCRKKNLDLSRPIYWGKSCISIIRMPTWFWLFGISFVEKKQLSSENGLKYAFYCRTRDIDTDNWNGILGGRRNLRKIGFFSIFIVGGFLAFLNLQIINTIRKDVLQDASYFRHNNGNNYYEAKGKGFPIVFIHGGNMDSRIWDDQFNVFAESNRVIRYDVRRCVFWLIRPPILV